MSVHFTPGHEFSLPLSPKLLFPFSVNMLPLVPLPLFTYLKFCEGWTTPVIKRRSVPSRCRSQWDRGTFPAWMSCKVVSVCESKWASALPHGLHAGRAKLHGSSLRQGPAAGCYRCCLSLCCHDPHRGAVRGLPEVRHCARTHTETLTHMIIYTHTRQWWKDSSGTLFQSNCQYHSVKILCYKSCSQHLTFNWCTHVYITLLLKGHLHCWPI